MHDSKIEAILKWSIPKTGEEISRFLGTVNFNRKHLDKFSWISAPLDRLRKTKQVQWNEELDKAFKNIKELVRKNMTLVVQDPTKQVLVGTDASLEGLGFWRGQVRDESKHIPSKDLKMIDIEIVEYGSIALSKVLKTGSVTKREIAAVVFAFKKCLPFLLGKKFTLYTDHQALVWLFTQQHTNPMLYRFIEIMLLLEFETIHWRGHQNVVADALSRSSCVEINSIAIDASKAAFLKDKEIPLHESERSKLVQDVHSLGHYGTQQVFLKIWEKGFWWPSIRDDIKECIGNCSPCLKFMAKKQGYHPLAVINSTQVGDHWAIDLFPLPKAAKPFKFVMTIVDIASSFAIFEPLMTNTANEIAQLLWKTICILGPPKILQTDNAKEFVGKVVSSLIRKIGAEHRTIASYHPQANGRVERSNAEAERILKKLCEGTHSKLVDFIPMAQLVYNTHISKRHLSQPFALMFGRGANAFENYQQLPNQPLVNPDRIKANWYQLTQDVFPGIQERVKEQQEQLAARFDATHQIIDDFTPGTFVLAQKTVPGSKWNERYEGPFEVVRKNEGGSYLLKDTLDMEIPYRYPPSMLKVAPYYQPSDDEQFEVKRIKSHRETDLGTEYLVEWKDSSLEQSWEKSSSYHTLAPIEKYFKLLTAAKSDQSDNRTSSDTIAQIGDNTKHPSENTDIPDETIENPHETMAQPSENTVFLNDSIENPSESTVPIMNDTIPQNSKETIGKLGDTTSSKPGTKRQSDTLKIRLKFPKRVQRTLVEENVGESSISTAESDPVDTLGTMGPIVS